MSVWGLESGHQVGSATENSELAVRLGLEHREAGCPFLNPETWQWIPGWRKKCLPSNPAGLGMSRPEEWVSSWDKKGSYTLTPDWIWASTPLHAVSSLDLAFCFSDSFSWGLIFITFFLYSLAAKNKVERWEGRRLKTPRGCGFFSPLPIHPTPCINICWVSDWMHQWAGPADSILLLSVLIHNHFYLTLECIM